jgi:hypothetical protein
VKLEPIAVFEVNHQLRVLDVREALRDGLVNADDYCLVSVADLLQSCVGGHSSSLTDSLEHLKTSHLKQVVFHFVAFQWVLNLVVNDKGILAYVIGDQVDRVTKNLLLEDKCAVVVEVVDGVGLKLALVVRLHKLWSRHLLQVIVVIFLIDSKFAHLACFFTIFVNGNGSALLL